ncbi:breast cancer associated RING 1 [Rhynchospora pubera]|uniref:Breast cancer associated RING 1 n=1 Tax=Rhynchospora pubera TaxID=906938 RepID=A0AAV8H2B7_9POAL|nr:breast cancer associated RING 1 [Rhynchospora pubera]
MSGGGFNLNGSSRSRLISDLREMEEKLKCLKCKKLLEQPTLLTCDHILCKECIPDYHVGVCPICKARFLKRNLKPALDIEEMLKKYQEKASIKVQRGDNVSPVRAFMEKSRPILSPGSNQRGSGLLVNNSCQHDMTQSREACSTNGARVLLAPVPRGFEKRAHELGISSSPSAVLAKLTRNEPPKDYSTDVVTNSEALARHGASQVHVPVLENEFQLRPPNFKMRGNDIPSMNPTSSRMKRLAWEELPGPSVKRPKMPVGIFEDECIFCHSFRRDLPGFGKLLCIQNGKVVLQPDNAIKAGVSYAHETCINWSPRIYYQGDKIMNLENEIRRTAKLICAKCGLKGAALSCYYEDCQKIYHPPCAYQVLECRWDTEKYLMLCPDHASEKLPCDNGPSPPDTADSGNDRQAERSNGAST